MRRNERYDYRPPADPSYAVVGWGLIVGLLGFLWLVGLLVRWLL
jgi:hypothetical protein